MRGVPIRALYRGEPCEVTLTLALANSGEMQIELIKQEDDTPSIYTEFLAVRMVLVITNWRTGQTISKPRWQSVRDAGWPVVWSGGEDVGTRFAYVEPPNSPAHDHRDHRKTERSRRPGMGKFVRDAAQNWDGSDPIRVLGG